MNTSGCTSLPAVIIGAGPYGLSLAAHLHAAHVPCRIFGRPMHSWATQMPAGMKLKSDGFASNLSSGSVPFTLEDFCKLTGRPYHATETPVLLEDFIEYGREFARRFVPGLNPHDVASVERDEGAFRLTTDSGETVLAGNVILALGLSQFQHMPEGLAHLPPDLITHTTAHRRFAEFGDRDVTVLGRGASSLTTSALLHESGARVTLIARSPKIHIDGSLRGKRSRYQRIRYPATPLGPSFRSWIFCRIPGLFQAMSPSLRNLLAYGHLGPAGGWTVQEYIEDRFPVLLGWSIESAELLDAANPSERRVRLVLSNAEMETREHITSHVVAGTGFRPDMERLRLLAPAIRKALVCETGGAPRLTRTFGTSVAGLYMVGPVASTTFGPLLRFAAGADFAARRVSHHLARELKRSRRRVRQRATLAFPASAAGD